MCVYIMHIVVSQLGKKFLYKTITYCLTWKCIYTLVSATIYKYLVRMIDSEILKGKTEELFFYGRIVLFLKLI